MTNLRAKSNIHSLKTAITAEKWLALCENPSPYPPVLTLINSYDIALVSAIFSQRNGMKESSKIRETHFEKKLLSL